LWPPHGLVIGTCGQGQSAEGAKVLVTIREDSKNIAAVLKKGRDLVAKVEGKPFSGQACSAAIDVLDKLEATQNNFKEIIDRCKASKEPPVVGRIALPGGCVGRFCIAERLG